MNQKNHYLKEKIKKVIGLIKDKSDGKIMTEFLALRRKTYSYLTDNNDKNIPAKDTEKCDIKEKHKFEDYKNWLEGTQQLNFKIN